MSRERFESPEDRANQTELARDLRRTWGWIFRDLSASNSHYNLDYFATAPGSSQGCAWVEVKVRHHKFGTFPTIMLSAGKWIEGCRASRETGLPFVLFFRFTDGVWQYVYDPKHVVSPLTVKLGLVNPQQPLVTFEWGGRTTNDRDEADVEPTAMIPVALWKKVELAPPEEPTSHPF